MRQDYLKILLKIKHGGIDNAEIKGLFDLMFNISREYFRRSNKNFLFKSFILPEDAAMETVEPLFFSESDGRFSKLITAFERWKPEVQSNSDALFFIHQLIYIRSEHYLVNSFKKHNPAITAFVNYINTKIKDEGFKKQHYCGTVYITNSENILPGVKIITHDEFDLIPDKIFFRKKLLLAQLFDYLKLNKFFPAIPFYLIIERVKNLIQSESGTESIDDSLIDTISIEEAANAGLGICIKKLIDTYTSKEKLTNQESFAFEKALQDIRFDLTDGGINGGYYEYLHRHLPDIDQKLFRENYENIFEYLVKILKQSTAKVLMEE